MSESKRLFRRKSDGVVIEVRASSAMDNVSPRKGDFLARRLDNGRSFWTTGQGLASKYEAVSS